MEAPLGLVLPGGGALCSWQGGVLETLSKTMTFQKVLGVSAGALNGGAYFTGRLPEEMRHWRDIDRLDALRLRPRLFPVSVFSSDPAWELVSYAEDDERARREARCDLTVLSLRDHDKRTVYSRFTPRGERGWDGPLADRLVASCAIPLVYPRVRVGQHYYRDGGTSGVDGAHFLDLADCATVVVIRPVRPDERGRRHWGPLARREQQVRESNLDEVEQGLASLRALPRPPRILEIIPSKTLDFSMLGFTTRNCLPAVELGERDARAFLARPTGSRAGAESSRATRAAGTR